ncbi:GNAT family N-acetyltransferase [Patescibacteria group bacterium]|nr:GNAT family N-acetyltransferase [Patescibacteria group bacterium]MBU1123634.1 GNAT family N-acetyltransferase [Patescibacteria group bacterium]MBU1911499.1 GNAT family N-acetyltransferase [Patescibacteria group bacterium]
MSSISIRKVKSSDSRFLWEWANDPLVRAASFSTDSIPWEDHEKWFDKKMNDPDCKIYIAEVDGNPIGQVRFDCDDIDIVVNVNLAPEQRGKGLGAEMMKLGIKMYFEETKGSSPLVREINAFVKIDNEPSRKMFEKIGFKSLGVKRIKGSEVFHFIIKEKSQIS